MAVGVAGAAAAAVGVAGAVAVDIWPDGSFDTGATACFLVPVALQTI